MQNTIDENYQPAAQLWVSLDVSRDTLDAYLLRQNNKSVYKQFANDAGGFAKLLRWVGHAASEQIVHFCLEATGAYSQAVALFLAEAGQRVSVVNPARIRFFGLAQAQGNKTDKADAALIARFLPSGSARLMARGCPRSARVGRADAPLARGARTRGAGEEPPQRALSTRRRDRVAARHIGLSPSRDCALTRADTRSHQRPCADRVKSAD